MPLRQSHHKHYIQDMPNLGFIKVLELLSPRHSLRSDFGPLRLRVDFTRHITPVTRSLVKFIWSIHLDCLGVLGFSVCDLAS